MERLGPHIEDLRTRLDEITSAEFALVKALDEALNRVDEQLLRSVRQVSSAHQARRGAILGELKWLASRLGVFPAPEAPVQTLEAEHAAAQLTGHRPAHGPGPGPGDWRQAARNVEANFDPALELDGDLDFDNRPPRIGRLQGFPGVRLDHLNGRQHA